MTQKVAKIISKAIEADQSSQEHRDLAQKREVNHAGERHDGKYFGDYRAVERGISTQQNHFVPAGRRIIMASVIRSLRAPLSRATLHIRPFTTSKLNLARTFTSSTIRSADSHGSSGPPQLYGPGGKAGEVPTEYVRCLPEMMDTVPLYLVNAGTKLMSHLVKSRQPVLSDSNFSEISWGWMSLT